MFGLLPSLFRQTVLLMSPGFQSCQPPNCSRHVFTRFVTHTLACRLSVCYRKRKALWAQGSEWNVMVSGIEMVRGQQFRAQMWWVCILNWMSSGHCEHKRLLWNDVRVHPLIRNNEYFGKYNVWLTKCVTDNLCVGVESVDDSSHPEGPRRIRLFHFWGLGKSF